MAGVGAAMLTICAYDFTSQRVAVLFNYPIIFYLVRVLGTEDEPTGVQGSANTIEKSNLTANTLADWDFCYIRTSFAIYA